MEPEQCLQVFFLLAASTVLLVNAIPPFRSRFLAYGSRTTAASPPGAEPKPPSNTASYGRPLTTTLDYLATFQVPHSWFIHFYIVSVSLSLFWALQYIYLGRTLQGIYGMRHGRRADAGPGMDLHQVVLTWLLMTFQGARRLSECIAFGRPSQSKMWVVHWLLGIGFYIAMSMAVWVEGFPALLATRPSLDIISIGVPSLRTVLCLPLFLLASGMQHDCHAYLASLPRYTLPQHPLFASVICPHYTAECGIYLSLALLAAPQGALVNRTVFMALIFVAANLGVTAEISRDWYRKQFGAAQMKGRWRMIPLLY